jgi:hypothetical protein
MNPVTRRLLDDIDNPDLADLALGWDRLEERIVRIYRTGACSPEEAAAYAADRNSLQPGIRRYERALEPHWKLSPVAVDPFQAVLAVDDGRAVVANWELMRLLPAAREALNGLLLERGTRSEIPSQRPSD